MSRPSNVTAEDIQAWEALRLEWEEDHVADPGAMLVTAALFPNWKPCDQKELFYAGEWLSRELAVVGITGEADSEICQSFGQKCFFSDDPWVTAQECLDQAKTGNWDKPGEELARRLFDEKAPALLAKIR